MPRIRAFSRVFLEERAARLPGPFERGGKMGKLKEKYLCKLVKGEVLEEDLKEYKKLVVNPTHLCTKCGRVCNEKKYLCKPERLD